MVKVLFVCIHNSARSQMAEAFLNKYGEGEIVAESAGFEPGKLNILVVKAMEDYDIDISENSVDSVFEFFKQGRRYNYVITVCDEGAAQRCPLFPGIIKRIHWSFRDPSSLTGNAYEQLAEIKVIRDEIKEKVLEFIELVKSGKIEENFPNEWRF